MQSSDVSFTKEKKVTDEQRVYLKKSLIKLGFNPKNNGFILFYKAIILAYELDMVTINISKLCEILSSKNKELKASGVNSALKYVFYNINTKKLLHHYEKIFSIEFDVEYFSMKSFMTDFVDLLENNFKQR